MSAASQSNIIPFNFEKTKVRVIDRDGEPWFVAADVAAVLGYSRPRDAVSRHCRGAVKHGIPTSSGDQEVTIIPERDVYRLIMRSRLPEAERFEDWVVGEVLPSIRKTGGYHTDVQMPVPQSFPEALRIAADLAEQNERQAAEIEELRPSAQALERIEEAEGSYCVTDAAKMLQVPPRKLFRYLRTHNWLYSRPGVKGDIAYQQRITQGFAEHKVHVVKKDDGDEMTVNQVRITPKGLAHLAKKAGDKLS